MFCHTATFPLKVKVWMDSCGRKNSFTWMESGSKYFLSYVLFNNCMFSLFTSDCGIILSTVMSRMQGKMKMNNGRDFCFR